MENNDSLPENEVIQDIANTLKKYDMQDLEIPFEYATQIYEQHIKPLEIKLQSARNVIESQSKAIRDKQAYIVALEHKLVNK